MLASYGHVRDLPSRSAAVRPDDGFAVRWARLPGADARLAALADAVRCAARLVLATDPDREGEAIAWHVTQELQARPENPKTLPNKPYPTCAARLVLAAGPDREGEATAWHIAQELQARPKTSRRSCRRALRTLKPYHISPIPHARRGAPGAGRRPRPRGQGHRVAHRAGAAGAPAGSVNLRGPILHAPYIHVACKASLSRSGMHTKFAKHSKGQSDSPSTYSKAL